MSSVNQGRISTIVVASKSKSRATRTPQKDYSIHDTQGAAPSRESHAASPALAGGDVARRAITAARKRIVAGRVEPRDLRRRGIGLTRPLSRRLAGDGAPRLQDRHARRAVRATKAAREARRSRAIVAAAGRRTVG